MVTRSNYFFLNICFCIVYINYGKRFFISEIHVYFCWIVILETSNIFCFNSPYARMQIDIINYMYTIGLHISRGGNLFLFLVQLEDCIDYRRLKIINFTSASEHLLIALHLFRNNECFRSAEKFSMPSSDFVASKLINTSTSFPRSTTPIVARFRGLIIVGVSQLHSEALHFCVTWMEVYWRNKVNLGNEK